jgi:flagellar protein FlaG
MEGTIIDIARTNQVPAPSKGSAPESPRSAPESRSRADARQTEASIRALRDDFRESVEAANERLALAGQQIAISIDKATNIVVVQVRDRESGEMIRQIPPEEALQVTRNIDRLTGILVDRKA